MFQDLLNSQLNECWTSTLGPFGPMATYSPSQYLQPGQGQKDLQTPVRPPQGATGYASRKKLDPKQGQSSSPEHTPTHGTIGDSCWRRILKDAQIDEERMNFLWEGFNNDPSIGPLYTRRYGGADR